MPTYVFRCEPCSTDWQRFYKMDDKNHGQGDLDDCVASKRMLIETGYVDGARIGIIGGSYGAS